MAAANYLEAKAKLKSGTWYNMLTKAFIIGHRHSLTHELDTYFQGMDGTIYKLKMMQSHLKFEEGSFSISCKKTRTAEGYFQTTTNAISLETDSGREKEVYQQFRNQHSFRGYVEKHRYLFNVSNNHASCRLMLDKLRGLGEFIQIKVPIGNNGPTHQEKYLMTKLCNDFNIIPFELFAAPQFYAELVNPCSPEQQFLQDQVVNQLQLHQRQSHPQHQVQAWHAPPHREMDVEQNPHPSFFRSVPSCQVSVQVQNAAPNMPMEAPYPQPMQGPVFELLPPLPIRVPRERRGRRHGRVAHRGLQNLVELLPEPQPEAEQEEVLELFPTPPNSNNATP